MSDAAATGTYDEKAQGLEHPGSYVKMWLDALAQAEAEEREWVKDAERVVNIYRGKEKKGRAFNILHSNVETLRPALYNSTPEPDVRRRFADADPAGKEVAEIIERALSYSVDAYDFDAMMKSVVHDGELVGRGVPRVRYVPTISTGQNGEELVYEEVTCDYVPWKYFRRGPGTTWEQVSWVAFGDLLSREELRKLAGDAVDKNGNLVAEMVPLTYGAGDKGGQKRIAAAEPSIFKRALVWQVWDRDSRRVVSICADYPDQPLAMTDDPLGLTSFFPVPRPYLPIMTTDSLVPVIPYSIYEDLVEELNDITRRIGRTVTQLRARALYAGNAADIKAVTEADDGELVPATSVEAFIDGGGLEKAIAWFPLDPIVKVLQQLVMAREQVKQVIYEVTGIADILRGSTQASETATAQQIKAQWGSLRIQERQAEVARLARDLFRLKAEIIATKFSWETLTLMTGISFPGQMERDAARRMMAQQAQQVTAQPQGGAPMPGQANGAAGVPALAAPQLPPPDPRMAEMAQSISREEVEQLLRSDVLRGYRVDIESDSTIRGDLTRNQQTMNTFLQGTAQFAQAMAPLVQSTPGMMPTVIEIYTAFARQFKLGKQAEDALDGLTDLLRKSSEQAQQQPDPETTKRQAEMRRIEADGALSDRKYQHEERLLAMQEQRERASHEREMTMMAVKGLTQPPGSMPMLPGPPLPEPMNVPAVAGAPDQDIEASAPPGIEPMPLVVELLNALRALNAPKRIVRDPETGRALGVETVTQ